MSSISEEVLYVRNDWRDIEACLQRENPGIQTCVGMRLRC